MITDWLHDTMDVCHKVIPEDSCCTIAEYNAAETTPL